jgi:DNA topoisomerase I
MSIKQERFLVIVESPTKCKTIHSYLKSSLGNVNVIASYGHIRQLPRTKGSVVPHEDFRMVWETNQNSEKHINNILKEAGIANKQNGKIILATDADREGEAISWHILQLIRENGVNCEAKRIVFQEITKKSIQEALDNPREIDINKVDSYFARLGLDYLVGFGISPILWTKLKGCKSAGRVQSAALRTLVEREYDIVRFKPQKYWTLEGIFEINQHQYKADLTEWQSKPIEKFMWTEETVNQANLLLQSDTYTISEIKVKNSTRSPHAPYTTSTMQQDASRRLGWRPFKTSKIAQRLYEGLPIGNETVGLITYMRTDSVRLADNALTECASWIKTQYGERYLKTRRYTSKADKTQDAHEAIRPTDISRAPDQVANFLDDDCKKLYELIWRRTVASQMSEVEYEVKNISIKGPNGMWNIHGRERKFDGFLKVIPEDEKDQIIHSFGMTDKVDCINTEVVPHMTQAPARFTEAGLIKHLDDVGIGRPSTYASIIDTLHTREYVESQNKSLVPTHKGFLVIGFLLEMCPEYIQDAFTAGMEDKLDEISTGKRQWKSVLKDFWVDFDQILAKMRDENRVTLANRIADRYSDYFFGTDPEAKKCPKCDGHKVLCLMRDHGFIGCSNHPKCTFVKSFNQPSQNLILNDDGVNVLLKQGPYGHYLHWEGTVKKIPIPDSLAKNMNESLAMKLSKLPRVLGKHPFTEKDISVNMGRYGAYIFYDSVYASCGSEDISNITLERALEILGAVKKKGQSSSERTPKRPKKPE